VTSANERTCLITSENLQQPDWTSLGECLRYLRKLHTIWYTKAKRGTVFQATPVLLLQVRSNRTPAALWYEQAERHTTYLTALSSIHIISPPTLRVAIPLASNEKPTSHPFKRKTNKRDRKKDKVCEICVSINTSSSERTADMAKQQTARTEIDFQPGRRVGGTSYRLSRRSRREGLLVQPSTCFAGCESELGRNLCSLFLPSCLDLPGC
jgi:hypothetical protein